MESEPFVHQNNIHRACTVLGIQQSLNKFKNIQDEPIRGHSQGNTYVFYHKTTTLDQKS